MKKSPPPPPRVLAHSDPVDTAAIRRRLAVARTPCAVAVTNGRAVLHPTLRTVLELDVPFLLNAYEALLADRQAAEP